MYDWIVDIDLITNVNKDGWKMNFSNDFLQKHNLNYCRAPKTNNSDIDSTYKENLDINQN